MKSGKGLQLFALYIACGAVFVGLTSMRLPPLVASHFGASGMANGFMTRTFYTVFMVAFVIGLPALIVLVTWFAVGNARARLNVPDRDYWLAPERRAATVAFLRNGILWFGVLLVTFLCYAHALVVRANGVQPPRLDNSWFMGGLVAFFIVLFVAVRKFRGRFRRTH
ncbi:MAG TPA: hypothetical protein VKC11_11455 [Steroidobacteraceae bacterium]|nr:hypothetical protein [Steroidobacteraceae bacterium]